MAGYANKSSGSSSAGSGSGSAGAGSAGGRRVYSNSAIHLPVSNSAPSDVEEVDLDGIGGDSGSYSNGSSNNGTGYNINYESSEEIDEILKNMSYEDYLTFISEIKDGYDSDISNYKASLEEVEKILERLYDGKANEIYKGNNVEENGAGYYNDMNIIIQKFLNNKKYEGTGYTREDIVNMSRDEQIQYIIKYDEEAKNLYDARMEAIKEIADPYMESNFSDLGIHSLDDYIQNREELERIKSQLEEAIKTTENLKGSCYYDYLAYTKDYADFKPYEPTESDKKDVTFTKVGGRDWTTYKYDYDSYKKNHPNVSPLEYVKMVKESLGGSLSGGMNYSVSISGISNFEEIETIIKLEETYPDLSKTYNYLFEKSPDKLSDYFEKSKYEFNNLTGQVKAAEFLNSLGKLDGKDDEIEAVANALGVSVKGLKDGLDKFGEGAYYSFEAFLTAIGAWDENRTMSAEEYERLYILYGLLSTDDKAKLGLISKNPSTGEYENTDPNSIIDYTNQYSGSGFLSVDYEISQGIGNMLPSMAISMAITYACPAMGVLSASAAASAGATVGAAVSGVSTGGNAYHGCMVSGASLESSIIYGIYSGTSSAISQRVLGAIPFLSNVKVSSIATYLQAIGKEATQESIQYVLDGLAQAVILGDYPQNEEELKEFVKGLGKSAAYGAITAGVLNLPALGTSIYCKRKFNTSMKSLGFTDEEIDSSVEEFRNNNPDAKDMNDNEIKKLYADELTNAMTKEKMSYLMKGINDNSIDINSLDSGTLKLISLYASDDDFDVVLDKFNLKDISAENFYKLRKNAGSDSPMNPIYERANKKQYITRRMEEDWYEYEPDKWRSYSDPATPEAIKKLHREQLATNYEILEARINALKEQYGDDVDVDMYWRVVNEKKTDRPDPSTYIKKDSALYKAWQAEFSDGNAYCVYSTKAYNKYVLGFKSVGADDGQYVFGKSTFEKIEKVMNDSSLTEAQKRVKYSEILGFDDPDYFSDGIVMVKRSTYDKDGNLIVQPSTGRESTANNMYSAYLHTSGGSIEAVLPQIKDAVETVITDPKTGRKYIGYIDKNTGAIIGGVEVVHTDMPKYNTKRR